MNNLRKNILKNFDRFLSFFNDSELYEETDNNFISEEILKFHNKDNFKYFIHDNDLIISICNVILKDNQNKIYNKIGCIKTELDEVLNDSSCLKIEKCYIDEK